MTKKPFSVLIYAVFITAVFKISLRAQTYNFTLDFEDGNLRGWTKTGSAFNNQPTLGDNSSERNRGPSNLQGKYWIGTYENYQGKTGQKAGQAQGDGPQGTLSSNSFKIPNGTLSFLIGGGSSPDTRVDLVEVDQIEQINRVLFTASGKNSESMERISWNLDKYAGRTGYIRIVDNSSAGWGHINVDDFKFNSSNFIMHLPDDQLVQVVQVSVPDLFGKKLDAALEVLKENKLIPGTITERKSERPEGTVINQKPAKGLKVFPQSKIDLVTSQTKIPVPDLIGKTQVEAISLLNELSLHIHYAGNLESEIDSGKITRQDPTKGNRIYEGDAVSVYTAVPPPEIVPPLTGHPVEEAREILAATHLTMGSITSLETDNGSGKIIDQNPSAGSKVKRWSPVSVTIAVGPEKVRVPDLTGLSKDEAEGILKESRLTSGRVTFTDQDAEPGIIINQNPPPDREVNIGTAVNLLIQETKYKVVIIPVSTKVDSGETIEFRAEVTPQADNVLYQFNYGDGYVSRPTNLATVRYTYKRPGNFSAYVTAVIDHRIRTQSEKVYISVIPGKEPPILLYIIAGGTVLLGGSVLGTSRYTKNKKTTEFLKKSVKQHKGHVTSTIDLKDTNISLGLKLRISADIDWISNIKFK